MPGFARFLRARWGRFRLVFAGVLVVCLILGAMAAQLVWAPPYHAAVLVALLAATPGWSLGRRASALGIGVGAFVLVELALSWAGAPHAGPARAALAPGGAPVTTAIQAFLGFTARPFAVLLIYGGVVAFGWKAVTALEREEPEQIHETHRILLTVLFTDIVGSTERAAELGDRRWRSLLERHHAVVRQALSRFQGREIDTAGDGFLATFEGPARAIECACSIRDAVRELGLEIRAGLHTGECDVVGGKVGGIVVHLAARVAAAAGGSEVLVSRAVKDLVAGAELRFEDRGIHTLKGIPGEWRLFAVNRPGAASAPPAQPVPPPARDALRPPEA